MFERANFKASAPRQPLPALLYLLHPCSRAHAPYLHPVGKASFELLYRLESKACFGRLKYGNNFDVF
jgi:hypothetical protein